jgi:hypothetical protein
MINSRQNGNDSLEKYISPDSIEKAPAGFTEKIMTRIHVESPPLAIKNIFRPGVVVPVSSAMIALTLIVLAIMFSSASENTLFSGLMKYISNLNFILPKIKMAAFSGFSLPVLVTYIATGFFILTLFDRVLNKLFRK